MLIDATYGRRTRAVIVMDTDHVILSAILPEIADKFDSVKLYDTSTNDAVLVASATRGNKLTAHNEALYNDFIAKASE